MVAGRRLAGIAPHDLRSSFAKLRRESAEWERFKMLLGYESVQTTERYLGTKQDLVDAPNDGLRRENKPKATELSTLV
jgi:site-specific recombinase XerD